MSSSTRAVGALLFAGLAAPVTVTAQLSKPEFGVAAGATFPQGDFTTGPCGLCGFNTGWQGMAFVAFRIRRSPLALRLDGSYGANTSAQYYRSGVLTQRRFGLLGGAAELTLSGSWAPGAKVYVLAGPGLYRVSETFIQGATGSSSQPLKLAYNLGGGVAIGLLFFEARLVHVDGWGNDVSYILVPITLGLRFGSW